MLVTLADQCDYKLMQFREEEKLEGKQLNKLFIFIIIKLYMQSKS